MRKNSNRKPRVSGKTNRDHEKKVSESKTLPSVATLQEVKKASLDKFGSSKNTKKAYKGHLSRGTKFLEEIVAERRASGVDEIDENGVRIDINRLAKAFDNPPNEYSAMALELFLVQKCFTEDLSASTGQGIHGAFAKYWDEM